MGNKPVKWRVQQTNDYCPECYGPIVAMVDDKNVIDFFKCNKCNFSYGGAMHGTRRQDKNASV